MSLTTTSDTIESAFNHNGVSSLKFKEGTAYSTEQYLTYAPTISWDTNLGQVAVVTLTDTTANMGTPSNLVAGAFYNIEVRQDATGGRLLVWSSAFKFSNNTAPTLSSSASTRDYFTFKSDGTNLFEQGRSQGIYAQQISA
jgi:hypothetical protein